MRTIGAPLTAAQKAAARTPYVTAVVQNNVEHVRRLDYANLNATVNAAGKHDIALAADKSATRVRIEGGFVKHQRILFANHGTPAAWDAWTNLNAAGSQVACAAIDTRVIVVYTDAAATGIRYRESTDSGATFGADTLLLTSGVAVLDLAVAYKNSAGDLAIFWTNASAVVGGNKRTAGVFGGAISNPATFAALTGIAATYAFDYELLITGTELTTTKPTVWTQIWGDGSGAGVGVWTTIPRRCRRKAA